ncbi:SurA N-terminal domain-containing protein [Mucilaginibacter sp. UR6-1]|uniref:peptidylprolyl isomerase n=1 Tax=Mucilaginibacter sp. UR6-1 TaxID=1435643 RepID=UPI001E2CE2DE|nr:SurA N-terminal domain-containing protein [Mucilaginibacter sp. UR6-1]MCC8409549.1 SurA N-terminal domain-containing protein [Mucilaginibacter sp. UR6-1]
MGIMSFLREKMGVILVIVIGIALFAFVAGEVIHFGGSFFRGDANTVGIVGDENISIQDFNARVEQNSEQFKQQSGQASITPQILSYVQENTWNQMISRAIITNQIAKLNITVGESETKSLISGNNPSPQIVQMFGNPQTGELDRAQLNNVLSNINAAKDGDPMKKQWRDFVAQIIESKKAEKYVALVSNGLYVNSLEAKDDYEAKNKLANFQYVALDYASIPDNKVTITDADYQEYYDAHKNLFKNKQELRSFKYVAVNGAASKEDSAAIKTQAEKLAADFKTSNNDSLFVQINAETKEPIVYRKKGQLDPALDSVMFNAAKGFVYGPYLSNGSYKVAKLVDSRVGPDSVKASHILISAQAAGGEEKALAKVDSLKKLIQGGRSFDELAKLFSEDKQSGEKGGSLGTFGRGAMVPAFDEAAFNGSKGELKVVTTQFGVHLIRIEDQKGSSKVVKVAVVDKPIAPSEKTRTTAYSKAQAFLAGVNNGDFSAEAKKDKLTIMPANDVNGVASGLPGLDNARELVRWVFKADVGDVSEQVFTAGDQYIVAQLTQIKPEGQLPLDAVKTAIEAAVRNKVKAKQLVEKMQGAVNGASSINQVAQKVGGKVAPAQNIVFANPVIPGVGVEYSVIGSVFGSQPKKVSKPVEGTNGVYAFVVDGFVKPAPLTNAIKQKQQLGQALLQRSQGQLFEALQDKANVKDYRAKFL